MRKLVPGLVLVGLGVLFLGQNLGWWSVHSMAQYWPAILIVVGLSMLLGNRRN